MREIRFRGKSIYSGEWVYGWLVIESNGTAWISKHFHKGQWEQVDPETVGQFTSLKDKNGKEIYEGNITELDLGVEGKRRFLIKITTVFREVVSHPDFNDVTSRVAITGVVFEWRGYQLFPNVDGKGLCDNENMVVIGNVHENSELLEQL